MIVLLHSTYTVTGNWNKTILWQFSIMRYLTVLCTVTVGAFFAISSYLYFNTFESIKTSYFSKLKSRTKSVLIPYFFWSVISFVYYFILVRYTNVFDSKTVPDTPKGIFNYIFMAEGDPPIWYLRTLFVFFIISPIIFCFVKILKKYSCILIVLTLITNMILMPPYTSVYFWLPHILLGAWLAFYGNRLLIKKMRKEVKIVNLLVGGGIKRISILDKR